MVYSQLPDLIPLENYNHFEGKLAASLKWLIIRVYEQEKDVPDKLRGGIIRDDEGKIQIDTAVLGCLNNGSLYTQAAAKIFRESHLVTQSHGAVLAALTDYGIDVVVCMENDERLAVSEDALRSEDPFDFSAHQSMIEALMVAHVRSVVTVERVVDAVARHTSVDDRERPHDSADALLFWINKICLLVRDDVERDGIPLRSRDQDGQIPEMEDLYEDISDGQCLCAMVAWYRPRELSIETISFNERMDVNDCQYNLIMLQQFCSKNLPWNPFHFEIEDLLYLHDSLQPNVNAFLTDLFQAFEPLPVAPPVVPEIVSSPRRFVPVQAIPDLRAANIAARSVHPPRVRNPFHSVHVAQSGGPSRSMSVMSQDSLMTNRNDAWKSKPSPDQWGPNVTNFGKLAAGAGSNGNLSQTGSYTRSDSLPAASIRLALEEKRRDHEKMKAFKSSISETERAEKSKAAFFAVMNRVDPQSREGSADNRLLKQLDKKIEDLEEKILQMNMNSEMQRRMNRTLSQPSVYQENSPATPMSSARTSAWSHTIGHGGMTQTPQPPSYGQQGMHDAFAFQQQQQGHYAQPQVPQNAMRASVSNGVLNYMPAPGQAYPPEYQMHMGQQALYPMQQFGGDPYSYQTTHQPPPYNMMHQSAHASMGFSLHQQPQQQPQPQQLQQQQMLQQQQGFASQPYPGSHYPAEQMYHQQEPQGLLDMSGSPSGFSLAQTQPPPLAKPSAVVPPSTSYVFDGGSPDPKHQNTFDRSDGASSVKAFKLHSNDTGSSLDPPLEMNRNLTNWGISYQQQPPSRQQRRTWENQTFIKSEQDLVNQPERVPTVPSVDDVVVQPRKASSVVGTIGRRSRGNSETPLEQNNLLHVMDSVPPVPSQASPPRDPSTNASSASSTLDSSRSSAPSGPAFVVDDMDAESASKIEERRREAKRAALLAKTMKRKEELETKADQFEQRNAERMKAEIAKKEVADQRKVDKELQRQRILDDYKRKKAEKEMGLEVSSARGANNNGRGHSQPPIVRTKSQVSESTMGGAPPRMRGQSSVEQRITVQSLQQPTHKLFSKTVPKSNRGLIMNALMYSVFPGAVNDATRQKTTNDLAMSDSKHFLVLFRDQKCQYRGLYTWDQLSDTAVKISGQGPPKCTEAIMTIMFKYDSGAKNFSQVPTKHLSATIDGFAIQDHFWQKARIPHSGGTIHRNN